MNKFKQKRISAQNLSYVFALIAIISSFFAVISIYITTDNLSQLRKINSNKFIAETAVKNFKTASNYLNNETLLYTITKDPIHLKNFANELTLNKSREKALDKLFKLNLTTIEHSNALNANYTSNIIVNYQIESLRLTSEGLGLSPNQIPKIIQDFSLPPSIEKLPDSDKLEYAQNLIFNKPYQEKIISINNSINNFSESFSSRLNQSTEATTLANLNHLKMSLITVALIGLLILLVTYLVFKFIFKPLTYYDKTLLFHNIDEDITLEQRGAKELKDLAYAFNKVTNKLKTKTAALENEIQHRQALEEFSETILFHGDVASEEIIFTERYTNIYGSSTLSLKDPKLIAKLKTRVHPDDVNSVLAIPIKIKNGILEGKTDYRILNANGSYTWNNIKYKVVPAKKNRSSKFYGRIIDIDEKKCTINKLEKLATLDLHSGLLNHHTTFERIGTFLKSKEGKNNSHALAVIDIDDFKYINDTLGHQMGDFAIKKIASVLLSTFNSNDIIGRIGGDEFMVLIKNQPGLETINQTIETINHKLHNIKDLNNNSISISASIGISIYNADGTSFEELFKKADQSQYKIKTNNKSNYQLYNKK